jgi:hydrogenase maturation protease
VPEAPRVVVVGLGNPDRGDDGVGGRVARLLRDQVPARVRIEEQVGTATGLIDTLRQADRVILVDAMVSGQPAGTVLRLDCVAGNVIPARAGASSSHGLGVAEGIGLARALGFLPDRCVLFAVEGAQFAPGADLSPSVEAAAREVVKRIVTEVDTEAPPQPQIRVPDARHTDLRR